MRRLAAGILLSLAASAPGAEKPLPIRDALRQALAHNLGLGIQRLQAVDSVDNLELADAAFDLRLRWSNTLGKARTLDEIRAGDFARDAWSSELALEQPLPWGGTLALSGQADRFWEDSNGVAGDRLVQVGTGVSYTQPLLRGGWNAVNLAPVVTARLGAGRSRLLLRAAVLDLMRSTEVGYWGLAASRSLVSLRETSLRSAESLLQEVAERRRLGAATLQEQLQAEADVANQRVSVLNARQQAELADTRLRRILGLEENGAAELGVDPLPTDAVPTDNSPSAVSAAGPDSTAAGEIPRWVLRLPTTNALLNALATICLVSGYVFIKRGDQKSHGAMMLSALITSAVFLGCYLTYHFALQRYTGNSSQPYQGPPALKPLYLCILVPHILLAPVATGMALTTVWHAWRKNWEKHRRLARFTFPIWLYVSVTGVIIYLMVYHLPRTAVGG